MLCSSSFSFLTTHIDIGNIYKLNEKFLPHGHVDLLAFSHYSGLLHSISSSCFCIYNYDWKPTNLCDCMMCNPKAHKSYKLRMLEDKIVRLDANKMGMKSAFVISTHCYIACSVKTIQTFPFNVSHVCSHDFFQFLYFPLL